MKLVLPLLDQALQQLLAVVIGWLLCVIARVARSVFQAGARCPSPQQAMKACAACGNRCHMVVSITLVEWPAACAGLRCEEAPVGGR